jgi:ketosteroid isomerase-like protein
MSETARLAAVLGDRFRRTSGSRHDDLHVQMVGDAAVVTFHLGPIATPSRRTLVFRRVAAEEWQLVHVHGSFAPNPASR